MMMFFTSSSVMCPTTIKRELKVGSVVGSSVFFLLRDMSINIQVALLLKSIKYIINIINNNKL